MGGGGGRRAMDDAPHDLRPDVKDVGEFGRPGEEVTYSVQMRVLALPQWTWAPH